MNRAAQLWLTPTEYQAYQKLVRQFRAFRHLGFLEGVLGAWLARGASQREVWIQYQPDDVTDATWFEQAVDLRRRLEGVYDIADAALVLREAPADLRCFLDLFGEEERND